MLQHEHDIMRAVEDEYWWYQALRRHLAECVSLGGHSLKVLDAGCGTGGTLEALRKRIPEADLVGVDVSAHAVSHAAGRGVSDRLVEARIEDMPFPPDSFDVVLSIDVLTAASVGPAAALREMHRVLRPNGRMLINVGAFEFLRGSHNIAVGDARRFTRSGLRQLMTQANFVVEQLTYWNTLLFPPITLWRVFSRAAAGADSARSDFYTVPRMWNKILAQMVGMELRLSRRMPLPFGTSLFGIARKAA